MTGRLKHGLTPWRRGARRAWPFPARQEHSLWDETWRNDESRLGLIESTLKGQAAPHCRGDAHAAWDLDIRGGLMAGRRLVMAAEDHGGGKQLVRFRHRLYLSHFAIGALSLSFALCLLAAADGAAAAATVFGFGLFALLAWVFADAAAATAAVKAALIPVDRQAANPPAAEADRSNLS
jgi:hypothetical protein